MKTSVLHINPSRRRAAGAVLRAADAHRVGRSIRTFLMLSALLGNFGGSIVDALRMAGRSNDVNGRSRFDFNVHKYHLRRFRNIRRGGKG
jgi:hypothetical protein